MAELAVDQGVGGNQARKGIVLIAVVAFPGHVFWGRAEYRFFRRAPGQSQGGELPGHERHVIARDVDPPVDAGAELRLLVSVARADVHARRDTRLPGELGAAAPRR